jgi:hypothetical protein
MMNEKELYYRILPIDRETADGNWKAKKGKDGDLC